MFASWSEFKYLETRALGHFTSRSNSGRLAISLVIFHSENPSSNPAEVLSTRKIGLPDQKTFEWHQTFQRKRLTQSQ